MIYIFDLEGTLSDHRHRQHCLPNYDEYHARFKDDSVIEANRILYNSCRKQNAMVVILTGKPEKYRAEVETWMDKNNLKWDEIIMRPDGDKRSSPTLKRQVIASIYWPDSPVMVFDDREDVVVELQRFAIPAIKVCS